MVNSPLFNKDIFSQIEILEDLFKTQLLLLNPPSMLNEHPDRTHMISVLMETWILSSAPYMGMTLDGITYNIHVNCYYLMSARFSVHVNSSLGICKRKEFILSDENCSM